MLPANGKVTRESTTVTIPKAPLLSPPFSGLLTGLYYQANLYQYVFQYCRNTLAGQVVTLSLPASLQATLPLNLDGGDGVSSAFPSLVSDDGS